MWNQRLSIKRIVIAWFKQHWIIENPILHHGRLRAVDLVCLITKSKWTIPTDGPLNDLLTAHKKNQHVPVEGMVYYGSWWKCEHAPPIYLVTYFFSLVIKHHKTQYSPTVCRICKMNFLHIPTITCRAICLARDGYPQKMLQQWLKLVGVTLQDYLIDTLW